MKSTKILQIRLPFPILLSLGRDQPFIDLNVQSGPHPTQNKDRVIIMYVCIYTTIARSSVFALYRLPTYITVQHRIQNTK